MSDIVEKNKTGLIAGLTAEQLEIYEKTFGAFTKNMTGGTGRYITFRGKNFNVREGGQSSIVTNPDGTPAGFLDLAILNIAASPHCLWYKDNYDPKSSESVPPTAIWRYGERPDPNVVPAWVLDTKRIEGNASYNHYQIKQRMVVVKADLTNVDNIKVDLDKPYIMDIPSMSIFSKNQEKGTKLFTLQQMLLFWERFDLYCGHVPVRMAFSTMLSTPVPLMAPFTVSNLPFYFPPEIQLQIMELAFTKDILQMLDVFSKRAVQGELAAEAPAEAPVEAQAPAPAPAPAPKPQLETGIPEPPTTAPEESAETELLEAKSKAVKERASKKLNKKETAAPVPTAGVGEPTQNGLLDTMDSILDGVPEKP